MAAFDFWRACEAITCIGHEVNRYVEATTPWALAKAGRDTELDAVLAELLATYRDLALHGAVPA